MGHQELAQCSPGLQRGQGIWFSGAESCRRAENRVGLREKEGSGWSFGEIPWLDGSDRPVLDGSLGWEGREAFYRETRR